MGGDTLMRTVYKLLSLWGDARALSRGPGSFVKRKVRSAAHRELAQGMRKTWLRP